MKIITISGGVEDYNRSDDEKDCDKRNVDDAAIRKSHFEGLLIGNYLKKLA